MNLSFVKESTELIKLIVKTEIPAQTMSLPSSAYPECPKTLKPTNELFVL